MFNIFSQNSMRFMDPIFVLCLCLLFTSPSIYMYFITGISEIQFI